MSVSPRRPKLPSAALGAGQASRLDDMSRQLNQALCNFAVVEDKLRTEQELGKAFYLLKQEKAELLRTKIRHEADGALRSKLEEKIHTHEVELQHTQQQLLAMRQRVVAVEAERDFIRAQANDFTAYWKEIEAAWNAKEAGYTAEVRRGELQLAQVEMQMLDLRASLEGSIRGERVTLDELATAREGLAAAMDSNRTQNVELCELRHEISTLRHTLEMRDGELRDAAAQNAGLVQKVDELLVQCKSQIAAQDALRSAHMDTKRTLECRDQQLAAESSKSAAALREVQNIRRELDEKNRELELLVTDLEGREAAARDSKAVEESLRRALAAKSEEISAHLDSIGECQHTAERLEGALRDRDKQIEVLKATVSSLEASKLQLSAELQNTQHRCSQLTAGKETLQRELAVAKKEAKTCEEAYAAATVQSDALQLKLDQAQQAIAAVRSDANYAKSRSDRSTEALERDIRSLTAEVSRRSEEVKLLEERLRAAHDARSAAEAVAARHEDTIRGLENERLEAESRSRQETARLLDRMQRQCVAMDAIAADLPTVEESRRRIAEAQRQISKTQKLAAAAADASPPRNSDLAPARPLSAAFTTNSNFHDDRMVTRSNQQQGSRAGTREKHLSPTRPASGHSLSRPTTSSRPYCVVVGS